MKWKRERRYGVQRVRRTPYRALDFSLFGFPPSLPVSPELSAFVQLLEPSQPITLWQQPIGLERRKVRGGKGKTLLSALQSHTHIQTHAELFTQEYAKITEHSGKIFIWLHLTFGYLVSLVRICPLFQGRHISWWVLNKFNDFTS